jgi:prepilin-type N-terminal cleavage/methylation domain-containing protein
MSATRGFTLVEVLMVIVIVGAAAAGIAGMQGSLFQNRASVEDMQVRTSLMQACAEQVLAIRRYAPDGYDFVDTSLGSFANCGGLTAFGGYAVPSVTVVTFAGAACPTNGICKTVTISQGGMAALTLMLVDY